jgi:hypothetical protein
MELAIPLIALGGLYIATTKENTNSFVTHSTNSKNGKKGSKKDGFNTNQMRKASAPLPQLSIMKQSQKEGFETAGKPVNYLPNLDQIPQNYPITNENEVKSSSLYEYPDINASTDKYFNQTYYQEQNNAGVNTGNIIQDVYSLTGNFLKKDEFTHNNMVPFVGGKISGALYDDKFAENVLDNMIGSGSQMLRKQEIAPLFKPEENVQYTNGTPVQTDFFQSRVNAGMNVNNVKPFESVMVGPGLGKGFTTNGSGGFNSGMEDREQWLPKTVDELRVETNPKITYTLDNHQGPMQSYVKNVGKLGVVEKNRPDTFFINTADRWLTTTGLEKGETLRPEQEMGIIRRNNVDTNYMGPAGDTEKAHTYVPSNAEPSKRNQWKEKPVLGGSNSKASNYGAHQRRQDAYVVNKNNRASVNQPDTYRSGFSGAIGAVVAPVLDMLRPSRKQELCTNLRVYGSTSYAVPAGHTYDTTQNLQTTTRETTLHTPRSYVNNQGAGGGTYINLDTATPINKRNVTDAPSYGTIGGPSTGYGGMSYESAYNQTCNGIKAQTIGNRANGGNMSLFNADMNVCISKEDCSQQDFRVNGADSVIKRAPMKENYGEMIMPNKAIIADKDLAFGAQRMEPSLLNAFNQNPYTQSLSSY